MKLKTFDTDNIQSTKGSSKKPLIGVNSKSGTIRINATAVDLTGLKKGQFVKFHQDEKKEDDWYLEVVKEKNGFLLREKESITPKGLITQSTGLVRKIYDSVAYIGASGHLQVGTEAVKFEGRTLWPLITGLLRNS